MGKLQQHKSLQMDLFNVSETQSSMSRFVSAYRISLVRDDRVSFGTQALYNPTDAQKCLQGLIKEMGQPDREQFCVLMLNAKNFIIGMNIVSVGGVASAPVHPREVLKPAILANACALILAHNHPSGDLTTSSADKAITQKIIHASDIIGITVHEHLIISMEDDGYFSFAEHGYIREVLVLGSDQAEQFNNLILQIKFLPNCHFCSLEGLFCYQYSPSKRTLYIPIKCVI